MTDLITMCNAIEAELQRTNDTYTIKRLARETGLKRKHVKYVLYVLQRLGGVTKVLRTPACSKKRPVYSAAANNTSS